MRLRRCLAIGLFAAALALPAAAAEKAIIVLDASGSMWAQIDGKARITIARETLDSVLATLPPDLELGLIAYGHRQKGQCDDIELLVPPAAGSGPAISAAVAGINPKGMTPLSDAVRLAAEDLRYTEQKATVILITDGLETCDADPCALATELEKNGVDFTAHVVGFGLSDAEGRQVACLAENTGGKYLQAGDATALAQALTTTVAEVAEAAPVPAAEPAPEPAAEAFNLAPDAALAEGGPSLPADADLAWEIYRLNADGSRGEWVKTDYGNAYKTSLDPGRYSVVARMGQAESEQPVTIEAGAVAAPYFVLNAGTLIVRPYASEGAEVDDNATVIVTPAGSDTVTNYGRTKLVLPAGQQQLTVVIGVGQVSETLALTAGQVLERDVVVGVGHLLANAYYVPGLKVEGDVFTSIEKPEKKIDGTREQLAYAYGPDSRQELPPGDYILVATFDQATAEVPFSIKSGAVTEAGVVLNAGVLAISAPGATFIEVFGAKTDIQGNRKAYGYAYAETHQTTLPAGDYVVVAHLPDGTTREARATVTAGERGELAVP